MIFGIPAEHLVPVANFIGLALLGLLALLGQRWGKRRPVPQDRTLELAGALIDSKAVDRLATVIETHSKDTQHDAEKARQALYRLLENIGKLTNEVAELRRSVADVATQVARMK